MLCSVSGASSGPGPPCSLNAVDAWIPLNCLTSGNTWEWPGAECNCCWKQFLLKSFPLHFWCCCSGSGLTEASWTARWPRTPPHKPRWVCDCWLLCRQRRRTSCQEQELHWQPLEKSPSPMTDDAELKAQQSLKLQHLPTEQPPTQLFVILKAWRGSRAKWQEQLRGSENAWQGTLWGITLVSLNQYLLVTPQKIQSTGGTITCRKRLSEDQRLQVILRHVQNRIRHHILNSEDDCPSYQSIKGVGCLWRYSNKGQVSFFKLSFHNNWKKKKEEN